MDAALYPDLVESGGLPLALQKVARSAGLDLGDIRSSHGKPAVISADRGEFSIYIGAKERIFVFDAWWHGIQMLTGTTPDLTTLAEIAHAWRSGARLKGLALRWPLVRHGAIAEAAERGDAAAAVAIIWREKLDAPVLERIRPLLTAAFAEPHLRILRPFTSHLVLYFSRCIGYPFSTDLPFVKPLTDGGYRVHATPTQTIGATDNTTDAIGMVVAALPSDCGPAILGTAKDL